MLRQLKQVKLTFWCMFLFHVQKKKNEWNCAIDQAKNLLQIFKKEKLRWNATWKYKKNREQKLCDWIYFIKGFFFFNMKRFFSQRHTDYLEMVGRIRKITKRRVQSGENWHEMEWKYFLLMLVKQLRKWRQLLSN